MAPVLPAAFVQTPITHRALHDGARGMPENSLAAAKAAVSRGYGIEIDVQPSSDGQAMVFHDATLDRMTDQTGRVDQRTAADLGQITLTGSADKIPTLPQLLDLVAGRVPLLIEIKDQAKNAGEVPGDLERAVAKALLGYGGPVAVMSFNPNAVAMMQKLSPHTPRGLTTCDFPPSKWTGLTEDRCAQLREIKDFDRTGAQFISHDCKDLSSPHVAQLKARGVPILCWTIKSPQDEAQARQIADNITFEGYLAPHAQA